MIDAIGSVRKAAAGYGRQQFYADRAQKLSVTKSAQVGLQDKVTVSPEAKVRVAQTVAIRPAIKSSPNAEIAYEDPRKTARVKSAKEKEAEPENNSTATVDETKNRAERKDLAVSRG